MTDLDHRSPLALELLTLAELRGRRRDLLEECARAARWHRLLQARSDLAVDAVAPTDDLAQAPAPVLEEVRDVVRVGMSRGGDPVDHLLRVDAARCELSRLRAVLGGALAETTGELVARFTHDPTRCLEPAPRR